MEPNLVYFWEIWISSKRFRLQILITSLTLVMSWKDWECLFLIFLYSGFQPASYQKRGINNFGLADMRGDEWRRTKRMVTPSFSAPRLKKTLPALNDCALKVIYQIIFIFWRWLVQLVDYLHSQEDKEFVDGLDFSKKYFLNCIASVGFGLNIDCFGEKESSFEKNAKYENYDLVIYLHTFVLF